MLYKGSLIYMGRIFEVLVLGCILAITLLPLKIAFGQTWWDKDGNGNPDSIAVQEQMSESNNLSMNNDARITIFFDDFWSTYIRAYAIYDDLGNLRNMEEVIDRGYVTKSFFIDCSQGYSLIAQKEVEKGTLTVEVSTIAGVILDSGETNAEFGNVSLAGTC